MKGSVVSRAGTWARAAWRRRSRAGCAPGRHRRGAAGRSWSAPFWWWPACARGDPGVRADLRRRPPTCQRRGAESLSPGPSGWSADRMAPRATSRYSASPAAAPPARRSRDIGRDRNARRRRWRGSSRWESTRSTTRSGISARRPSARPAPRRARAPTRRNPAVLKALTAFRAALAREGTIDPVLRELVRHQDRRPQRLPLLTHPALCRGPACGGDRSEDRGDQRRELGSPEPARAGGHPVRREACRRPPEGRRRAVGRDARATSRRPRSSSWSPTRRSTSASAGSTRSWGWIRRRARTTRGSSWRCSRRARSHPEDELPAR